MRDALDRFLAAADPARAGQQSDRQIGAGPDEVNRVESSFGETRSCVLQRFVAFVPRCLGLLVVEAADVQDLFPELVERRLWLEVGVDELGPLGSRCRGHAPVHRPLVDHRRPLLHPREDVPAEPLRIEVVVQVRSDRPAQRDRRAALLAQLQRALSVPRRDEVEHVVSGVLHTRALQVRVPVADVDELRTAPVCARSERSRQLLLAQAAADVDDLTRLDVCAEVDDQVGIALETVLHGKAILSPARKLAHARAGRDRSLSRIPEAR